MDASKTSILTKVKSRHFNAGLFILALSLRFAFLAVFQFKNLGEAYGRDLYFNLAQSWLGWMPMPDFDATHPPLYTGFIAAVLGLSRSSNPLPILILQCLLGAGSVLLVRRIGMRLVDDYTARLAALWVALDPALIFFTPHLQTETVFVVMELVFFWGLFVLWDKPLSGRVVALGLWGGLCVLCRSMFGAYPAFLFLALWRAQGLKRAFFFCAVLGLGWFVPTGVWTARNYLKYGRMVPMSAQMGWTLYEGFTLDREEVRRRPYEMGAEAESLGITDPLAMGTYFMDKTSAFVRERPFAAAKIILGKMLLYWRPWPYDPYSLRQRVMLGAYYSILFVLALFGARAAWSSRVWMPVWALFAYLTAVHSVFFTSLRYRLPLEPFLCLLAAAGLSAILRRDKRRSA